MLTKSKLMELFFTARSRVPVNDRVVGLGWGELAALSGRRLVSEGMPVLLDEAMPPVETLSSWFRHLAVAGRSPKTRSVFGRRSGMFSSASSCPDATWWSRSRSVNRALELTTVIRTSSHRREPRSCAWCSSFPLG
ncbi:hypothetical protein [Amycolatopsis sp. 195334CR]|uniref:hypothetical protein n=1 Tax=Amycolatopsis sp. 195334CR TaxID=2814588 RepID=UPI001A90734A|nr:hypothetical protein [Amycolatopsis sp. 195334CR]MBN6034051.1 hypothetical protein [Amycolatopsis sp. 195334CR]